MKLLHLTYLFDIYGNLLTEKQQDVFEDYYHDNLSLREIAEKYDISPQGVRDNLKRTETSLLNYEEKLEIHHNNQLFQKNRDGLLYDIENLPLDKNIKENLKNKINLLDNY